MAGVRMSARFLIIQEMLTLKEQSSLERLEH